MLDGEPTKAAGGGAVGDVHEGVLAASDVSAGINYFLGFGEADAADTERPEEAGNGFSQSSGCCLASANIHAIGEGCQFGIVRGLLRLTGI
ncbi:hypothetical protein [Kribbella sp. DT2]|uniref:hypothetical protein n=1 Tax=Kribbella sp. DT2 TaxID=3393427 RepID=UPI003CF9B376